MSAFGTLAVDAIFSALGIDATYTAPSGAPVACRVIRNLQDQTMNFHGGKPFAQGRVIEVRASEIAAPVKGGAFVVGADAAQVVSDPETLDPDRLVWTCRVA